MAISRSEAKKKAKAEVVRTKVFRAELEIDRALVEDAKEGRSPTTIAASLLGGRAAIDVLMEKYESAGWKVRYVDDWRDGDYLEIK